MDMQDNILDEEEDFSEFTDDGSTPDLYSIVDCINNLTPHSQTSPVQRAVEADVELQISEEFPPTSAGVTVNNNSPEIRTPPVIIS